MWQVWFIYIYKLLKYYRRPQQQQDSASIKLCYTFMHTLMYIHKNQDIKIQSPSKSFTSLSTAILTFRKGYSPNQAAQGHCWVVVNRITKSICQSDRETSLMQLISIVAADLNLKTRVSPLSSHYSQGKAKRFQRNLFDHFDEYFSSGQGTLRSNLASFLQCDLFGPVTHSTCLLFIEQVPVLCVCLPTFWTLEVKKLLPFSLA